MAIGTAGQVLKVNSSANGVEWEQHQAQAASMASPTLTLHPAATSRLMSRCSHGMQE